MRYIFTLLIATGFVSAFAQDNPGFFEMRLVAGMECHQVLVQMRPVSTALPVHENDDCQGIPELGNTINYDLTFTLFWSNTVASITDCTDVLSLDCVSGGSGYNVRDVGPFIDLPGGFVGQGFANGNFTPLDFPVSWPLNVWQDIVMVNMVGYNCELGPITNVVQIVSFGMFSAEEDPNIAMDLPEPGVITDYTPSVEGVLPLDLLSFSAEKHGDRSASITWSTINEVNTNHFVVERSTDRTNWKEVGKVKAADESFNVLNYQFVDVNVYDGRSNNARYYYRLLVVDNDGRLGMSGIDVVQFEKGTESSSVFVFPNPSTLGVNIELDFGAGSAAPVELVLYNHLGQLVYRQEIPEGSVFEYIDYSKTQISAGAYTLQVLDALNGIIATEKLIVQR